MQSPNSQSERKGKLTRRDFIRGTIALGGSAVAVSLGACSPANTPVPPTTAPVVPTNPPVPATSVPPVTVVPTVVSPVAKSGGQFVMVDGNDATTLDPHASPDVSYTFNLCRGPFEPLVEYVVGPNKQVSIGPVLAKSWDSKDAVVWNFQLNPGLKFTDNTPCDAAAIKWNFDRIQTLKLGPAGRLGTVKSVEAVDPQTVRITLPGPNSDFLNYVSMMLMVSPKSMTDHEQGGDLGKAWAADNIAAGTGPFLIKSRIKGSETIMQRNPDYWRSWSGNHVDSVVVRVVQDATTRYLLLDKGEAHLATNIALTDIENLLKNQEVVVDRAQSPGAQLAGFRFRGPLLDVNVRQALAWAFDSVGFIKSALRGYADVPRGLLFTDFRFFNPEMPEMKQDLAKAKDFLSKSKTPNGGFALSMMTLPTFAAYQTAMAQIFQENLKALNITLNIKPMSDLATYYASMADTAKGDDIWAWSGAGQTPDYNFQARRQWHSTYVQPMGVNGGYKNPTVDSLLEEDMRTLDMARRKDIWFELQRILMADMPFMPFAINHVFWTRRKNLQGAPYNVFSLVPNYYNLSFA